MVVQILLVRTLSKDSYGAFAYALSVVAFLQTGVTFGLDRTITRFIPLYQERDEYDRIFGTIVTVAATLLSLSLGVLAVGLAFHDRIHGWLGLHGPAGIVLAVLIVLGPMQSLDDLVTGLFAVVSRPRAIFFRRYVLAPGLRLAVVLTLVVAGTGVVSLAAGYAVAGVIGTVAYVWMLLRALDRLGIRARLLAARPRFCVRELFAFTVPLLTTDLVYAALGLTDVLLLAHYRGSAAVGGLRAVQPIAQLNQIVFSTFLVLFTPVIARHFARNETRQIHHVYWQTARWIALATLPVFVLTVDLAGPVTTTLFGARYGSSATVLAILSVGYYVQAAFGFNGTTLMVYGRLRYIVSLNAVAVVVNVLLNLALVPRYGATGAALGTTGTLIAHNLLKQIGLRAATGIRLAGSGSARFYATLVLGICASLVAVKAIAFTPAQVAVALAAVVVVVRVNRPALMVVETFPELARIPLVRSLLT